MTDDPHPTSPRDKLAKKRERSIIFDRIHRSPRIPDRYAARRAVSR